ncbi:hypothetical protein ACFW6S_00345 [Streptomyces sp. NPDC058740]|uniref:hypothetical protein n=1 Tax=Streptomyces sp. NPDC058740 TaxID=3346619 RepID=UPI0036C8C9FB
MEIHVHVPVRIALTGEPGPDELAALVGRLTALVAGRVAQAEREVRRRFGAWGVAGGDGGREVHDPGRDVDGGYALPSYAGAGRPTRVRVLGKEPWTVVGTARARIGVGRFLGYVEEVLRQPLPESVLYASLARTVRPVDVWLVRQNRMLVPHELGEELVVRSTRPGDRGTEAAWALAGGDAALFRLADADESGSVAAGIPRIPPHHVLFASMRLPRLDIADFAALGPGRSVFMTVREAGFCVDEEVFERATGVAWSRYAEEYPSQICQVRVQPAVLHPASNPLRTPAGLARDALFLLLDRHAGAHPGHAEPAARLFVAEADAFPGLPEAVLPHAEWPGDVGDRVLYCRASLDLAPETLGRAFFGPRARRLAGDLVPLIGADGFAAALDAVLAETLSQAHGGFGGLFGHVLASIERHGRLGEFFDAADATRRFALRLRLLQQCEATPYAGHERVRALRAALGRERAATTAHAYTVGGPGRGSVRLHREADGTVPVGGVLGEVEPLYGKTATVMRPKPGRAEALRAALLDQRQLMVEQILAGRDQGSYTEDEFTAMAVERAARAVRITADDFESVEIETGIRLLEVYDAEEQGLPSHEVRFEIVSRVAGRGEQWGTAVGPLREAVGAFEARLVEWRLGRAGQGYRIAGFAVIAVTGLALAWEAGAVAALVRLGGGIKAVRFGIGFSEAVYLGKVLFGHEEFTAGGFLMAAVDGYLGVLGYRIGGGLGSWAGERIGTATLRARMASWLAARFVTGAVGGAFAAVLETFAHDVVAGRWSGIDAYVAKMEYYAVIGVVAAYTVDPFLQALLKRAGPTLVKAALLTRLLSTEGVTAERWAASMALTRRRMEQAMGQGLSAAEARAWSRAIGSRLDEAAEGLAHTRARPTGTASRVPARIEPAHETPASAPAHEPHDTPASAAPHESPPSGAPHEAPASASVSPAQARPPAPVTRWQSWKQLKRASLTDREAAHDRRWYESARPEELLAREASDPVVKGYLSEAWGGARHPYRPERPSDPAVQDRLREDLRAARAAVEAERRRLEAAGLRERSSGEPAGYERLDTLAGVQWVEPTAKAAAGYEGTVAVARSDIPALAGERFSGGSPRALGSYDPAHDIRPPDTVTVRQAHGHAEQDLGQQLDARLSRLTEEERAAARGRTVYIRVDQEVCSVCAAALGGGPRGGVLARLSARHPDIVFEVTADDISTVYRIVAGRRVK